MKIGGHLGLGGERRILAAQGKSLCLVDLPTEPKRPFKHGVVGSNPTRLTFLFSNLVNVRQTDLAGRLRRNVPRPDRQRDAPCDPRAAHSPSANACGKVTILSRCMRDVIAET